MDDSLEILGIDHVGLHVADVQRSLAFYRDVLGFPALPRPDLGFPGAWLRVGPAQELHLLGRGPASGSPPVERHWAVEVRDVDAWRARLERAVERGVVRDGTLRGPAPRPDGARQLFVRDPDGHVLELLERPR
ncbi:MAG: VOC family protein [Planctomycetes bacterium]|nr:VOC family protein [Planctomycetota bacterium]